MTAARRSFLKSPPLHDRRAAFRSTASLAALRAVGPLLARARLGKPHGHTAFRRCGGYREVRWAGAEVRGWFWQYRATSGAAAPASPSVPWDPQAASPPDRASFAVGNVVARLHP